MSMIDLPNNAELIFYTAADGLTWGDIHNLYLIGNALGIPDDQPIIHHIDDHDERDGWVILPVNHSEE